MDLALTFHVGLCLRIPRSEREKLSELPVEPFAESFRYIQEASDALAQAQEISDYQSIGVRCREALLAFVAAAQAVMPWTSAEEPPKKADLNAWADHICGVALAGASQRQRRHLFKTLLERGWEFVNWLVHAKSSNCYDAEAAFSITENAIGICTSTVIRHIRGVPEHCPACGSQRLAPQRGFHRDVADVMWERPTCGKCGWAGAPVPINEVAEPSNDKSRPEGDCVVPTMPLRQIMRPETKSRVERRISRRIRGAKIKP